MSDQGFILDKRLRIVMKCYISENDVPENLRKNLVNKTGFHLLFNEQYAKQIPHKMVQLFL